MTKKLQLLWLAICFIAHTSNAQNANSSKRIFISNPTKIALKNLIKTGIDLRCGAYYKDNGVQLDISAPDLKKIDSLGIPYKIEIKDLTSFYKNRAAANLITAQRQLKIDKTVVANKTTTVPSNIILDNQLQYSGLNEVDWAVPQNFHLGSMGGSLTVQQTLDDLDKMHQLYPNLISAKTDASPTNQKTWGNTLGSNANKWPGQTIYYVRITGNQNSPEGTKPEILYTSMIHARELSALMNQMYFMWYLLENYATDPAIKNLVDNNELYFVPIVNPDGLKWNEKIAPNGGGMQRKNLRPNPGDSGSISSSNSNRGVDLNRNFNYFWGSAGTGSSGNYSSDSYRGPSAFSEPESQIMRDFILAHNFKIAVWHHSYSNAIPHPYGGNPTFVSGREDEMAKWHEDMTRYNRYISGATIFPAANGIADDWMVGGNADANGSVGSGKHILATTPESGHSSEGGFWPSTNNIVPIAKRAMRINLMNAYYGGKYAKLYDLTQSNITGLSANLTFGIERIGQTSSNFTITVTPVSSNIQSITSPSTQTGMSILEHRDITAAIQLKPTIQPNDKIEYNVKLSNDYGVFYEANFDKYYQPTLLLNDNPDNNSLTTNWVSSANWLVTSTSAFTGSKSIKNSSAVPYANNSNTTLTTKTGVDLSNSNKVLVQFYTKWDMERNFDFVEFEGSTDNGATWQPLHGLYDKPAATSNTNDSHSGKNSTSWSFQSNKSKGRVYDGDEMDNWVLEEIVIDGTNNSFLKNATNAKFRFHFMSDANNKPENYSTTYNGFYIDDFKIIGIQIPCVTSVPTGLTASNISATEATINWDNIPSATYDLRYRVAGTSTWTDLLDLTTTSKILTGLTASTNYEVQVRSKCSVGNTSAYTSSINFTTTAVSYCSSSGNTSYNTDVTLVSFNTIQNATSSTKTTGYNDFTSISTNITIGSPYNLTVHVNTDGNYTIKAKAWIDWNHNGNFTDTGEEYDLGTANNVSDGATTLSPLSITIPTNAIVGNTRMRVSAKYNAYPTPCETNFDGEVEDYTVNIVLPTTNWIGVVSSDWNNASNWDNGLPNANLNAVIPSVTTEPIINNASILVGNLTIDAGSNLTVNAGKSLTISGNLTNTGTITINSDASNSGSLIVNGTATGNITYNRYLTSTSSTKWHLVGAPVGAQSINTFVTTGANNIATSGVNYSLTPYNNTVAKTNTAIWTHWTSDAANPVTSAGNFIAGKGYEVLTTADGTVGFTGTIPTANVAIAITKPASGNAWNLIANPYPSSIFANANADATNNFITVNSSVMDPSFVALYLWNPNTSLYDLVNQASAATYIAPGQGFFVKSISGGGTVNFTTAMRTNQPTVAFQKASSQPTPSITLIADNHTGKTSTTTIKYIAGKSLGLDPGYDAGSFGGISSNFNVFTHLVNDNGVAFALQVLPDKVYDSTVIPIGLNAKAGTQITFKAAATNLPIGKKVFLEDRVLGVFNQINSSNKTYSVTLSNTTNGVGRFFLHTLDNLSTLGVNDFSKVNFSVIAQPKLNNLQVIGNIKQPASISIYDTLGRIIKNINLKTASLQNIPITDLAEGIYFVKVNTDKSQFSTKIAWY